MPRTMNFPPPAVIAGQQAPHRLPVCPGHYFLISAYPISFAHSSSCLAAYHLVAQNERPVKRNNWSPVGRFEDTNFFLNLSPFLLKNDSTVDEFQYVCSVVAITPPYAEINLVIAVIVLMAYTKKLGATYSEV